jgi:hypothetical protein
MKYLVEFLKFRINESNNIDDILDRMNRGEKITDVELQSRGIDPEKFPKSNKTTPTIHLYYNHDKNKYNVILSEETPKEIIFKMFGDRFNDLSIVEGYENDTSVGAKLRGGDDEKPIKWTIITNNDGDFYKNIFCLGEDQITGEKVIYAPPSFRIGKEYVPSGAVKRDYRKLYPNWNFIVTYPDYRGVEVTEDINDIDDEDMLKAELTIFFGNAHHQDKEKNVMKSHLKEYICQMFGLKENEWEINTGCMGLQRFISLADYLLGKQDNDNFYDGEITGKIQSGKVIYF